jgi:hypothetical protein
MMVGSPAKDEGEVAMPFRFGKTASVPRWSGAFPARPFTGVHLRYAGVNGPFHR